MSFGPAVVYTNVQIDPRETDRVPSYILSQILTYVNGGIVFPLPPGFYTTPPHITASFKHNGAAYSPTTSYVVHVTNVTTAAVNIRANRIDNGGSVAEAGTGDIDIVVKAFGN